MGRVFICCDPVPPAGMVCSAGPQGCGYCTGRAACGQPVPAGEQDWSHLDDAQTGPSGADR